MLKYVLRIFSLINRDQRSPMDSLIAVSLSIIDVKKVLGIVTPLAKV